MNIVCPDKQRINQILTWFFISFIFMTLSFGRIFSLLRFGYLYITEIALIVASLVIMLNLDKLTKIPRAFLILLVVYSLYGWILLIKGFSIGNLIALRDVVICGYILFFPATLIIFYSKKRLEFFIALIIFANIMALIIGRVMLYRAFEIPAPLFFLNNIKAFNFLLFYGISFSFLFSCLSFIKGKFLKIIVFALLAANVYMVFAWGERTAWVAFFTMLVFLSSFFPFKQIIRRFIYAAVFLLVITFLALTLNDSSGVKREVIGGKFSSLIYYAKSFSVQKKQPEGNVPMLKSGQIPDMYVSPAYKSFYDVIVSELPQEYKTSFSNIEWRFGMWRSFISVALESPVFGKGFGFSHVKTARPITLYAGSGIKPSHNSLTTIFYKMGFVGLFLFVLLNSYILLYGYNFVKQTNNNYRKLFMTACLSSFIYWHSLAFFFDLLDSPPTSVILWFIVGIIFACGQTDDDEEPKIS
jgi:hypothetical protein